MRFSKEGSCAGGGVGWTRELENEKIGLRHRQSSRAGLKSLERRSGDREVRRCFTERQQPHPPVNLQKQPGIERMILERDLKWSLKHLPEES